MSFTPFVQLQIINCINEHFMLLFGDQPEQGIIGSLKINQVRLTNDDRFYTEEESLL